MISVHYCTLFMIATLLVFSVKNIGVSCDGQDDFVETTQGSVNEYGDQQESERPPLGEGYDASPPADEGNPPDLATGASEDHTEINQSPNGEDQPALNPDEQPVGEEATPFNIDDFPTEEPDKFGEELLATCKAESNYQGDFSDPSESSRELKCFYACALVRMDVMAEVDGQMNFSEQVADDLVADALGDNQEMIEKYKSAITACKEEVPNGEDKCEYAYAFITCGIQKVCGTTKILCSDWFWETQNDNDRH